jgi:hypothetical protein
MLGVLRCSAKGHAEQDTWFNLSPWAIELGPISSSSLTYISLAACAMPSLKHVISFAYDTQTIVCDCFRLVNLYMSACERQQYMHAGS